MSHLFAPPTPQSTVDSASVIPDLEQASIPSDEQLESLDLSDIQRDKSFSIHKHLKLLVHTPELIANVNVIDLENVSITKAAKVALARCYLTPEFMLDKFGSHYKKSLLSVVTSGKHKGATFLNPLANEYRYETGDAFDIVVTGACVEREGKMKRQVHIKCLPCIDSSTTTNDPTQL